MNEQLDFILRLIDRVTAPAKRARKSLGGIDTTLTKIKKSGAMGAVAKGAKAAGRAFDGMGASADRLIHLSGSLNLAANSMSQMSRATGAVFLAPVREAATFERSMSRVRAITADFTEEQTAMARALGRDTKFTADQAAGGMANLAIAGFTAKQQMAAIGQVLSLDAAAGMEDLAETAQISSRALKGFGLPATDMTRVADVMTKTFTSSNTTLRGLGETFAYVAPIAKSLGVSIEETAILAGVLGDAGIDASRAGTGMRLIMRNLAGSSPPAAKALKELHIATETIGGDLRPLSGILKDVGAALGKMGSAKRMRFATDIFGARGSTAGLQLIEQISESGESFEKLSRVMDGTKVTADGVATVMEDNLLGDITKVESAVSDLKIEIGNAFMPQLREYAQLIQGEIVPAMKSWTTENREATKSGFTFMGIVSGITAALAGVAIVGSVGAAMAGGILKFGAGLKWLWGIGGKVLSLFIRIGPTIGMELFAMARFGVQAIAGLASAFLSLGAIVVVALGIVVAAVVTWWDEITEIVRDMPSKWLELGADMASGLIEGWKTMFGGWNVVEEMDAVIQRIKSALGIHSPSTVMMKVGEHMADGMSIGMNGGTRMDGGSQLAGGAAAAAAGGRGGIVFRPNLTINVSGDAAGAAGAEEIGSTVMGQIERWFDTTVATAGG